MTSQKNLTTFHKNVVLIKESYFQYFFKVVKLEKNNVQDIQSHILDSLYQIRKDLLEEIKANSVYKKFHLHFTLR